MLHVLLETCLTFQTRARNYIWYYLQIKTNKYLQPEVIEPKLITKKQLTNNIAIVVAPDLAPLIITK